jgi:hypothetical protein
MVLNRLKKATKSSSMAIDFLEEGIFMIIFQTAVQKEPEYTRNFIMQTETPEEKNLKRKELETLAETAESDEPPRTKMKLNG